MKCPICNKGELRKGKTEYSELGIYFGGYPADICTHCGEAWFDEETSKKIEEKSKRLGLFGLAKRTLVGISGNSLAIRIPKKIAKFTHLKKGEAVLVKPYGKEKIEVEIISKK